MAKATDVKGSRLIAEAQTASETNMDQTETTGDAMTEQQASQDLHSRGVWQMAPGLWCDKSEPGFIAVDESQDTALKVRSALEKAGQLPDVQSKGGE